MSLKVSSVERILCVPPCLSLAMLAISSTGTRSWFFIPILKLKPNNCCYVFGVCLFTRDVCVVSYERNTEPISGSSSSITPKEKATRFEDSKGRVRRGWFSRGRQPRTPITALSALAGCVCSWHTVLLLYHRSHTISPPHSGTDFQAQVYMYCCTPHSSTVVVGGASVLKVRLLIGVVEREREKQFSAKRRGAWFVFCCNRVLVGMCTAVCGHP